MNEPFYSVYSQNDSIIARIWRHEWEGITVFRVKLFDSKGVLLKDAPVDSEHEAIRLADSLVA